MPLRSSQSWYKPTSGRMKILLFFFVCFKSEVQLTTETWKWKCFIKRRIKNNNKKRSREKNKNHHIPLKKTKRLVAVVCDILTAWPSHLKAILANWFKPQSFVFFEMQIVVGSFFIHTTKLSNNSFVLLYDYVQICVRYVFHFV